MDKLDKKDIDKIMKLQAQGVGVKQGAGYFKKKVSQHGSGWFSSIWDGVKKLVKNVKPSQVANLAGKLGVPYAGTVGTVLEATGHGKEMKGRGFFNPGEDKAGKAGFRKMFGLGKKKRVAKSKVNPSKVGGANLLAKKAKVGKAPGNNSMSILKLASKSSALIPSSQGHMPDGLLSKKMRIRAKGV